MKSLSKEDNQLGLATFLIDKLALRVGNEKGEDEADTVGCCSLRVEHLSVQEPNKITFDFLGKDSMRYLNTIEVPEIVFKNVKSFFLKPATGENKGKLIEKDAKEDIFDLINAGKLNDHLKTHMHDLSAKVFRTYNASITLQS
jgi:DNA topoisomerase-1